MSTTSFDRSEWAAIAERLHANAVAVKRRSTSIATPVSEDRLDYGILASPALTQQEMLATMGDDLNRTNGDCPLLPQGQSGEVVVIGWGTPVSPLAVWRGSAPEFNSEWRVD